MRFASQDLKLRPSQVRARGNRTQICRQTPSTPDKTTHHVLRRADHVHSGGLIHHAVSSADLYAIACRASVPLFWGQDSFLPRANIILQSCDPLYIATQR